MFKKWLIGFSALLLLLIAGWWYVYSYASKQKMKYQQARTLREKYVGKDFPMDQITDLDGRPVTRKIFRNKKYSVVDFWFAGCSPCIEEMKNFPRYLEEDTDLQIVSVSVDPLSLQKRILAGQRNPAVDSTGKQAETAQFADQRAGATALSFLTRRYDDWHHLNKEATAEQYSSGHGLDIWYFPSYFLVDADGKILDRYNVFAEYYYSPMMKFIRDRSGFLYFLVLNRGLFMISVAGALLFYLIASGLFLSIRKTLRPK